MLTGKHLTLERATVAKLCNKETKYVQKGLWDMNCATAKKQL